MNGNLAVHFLPSLVSVEAFRGCVAIVVDLLRASTTITCALSEGAVAIRPFCEIDQAQAFADRQQPRPLLGGERKGVRIDGFDLDNSPIRYSADMVAGREIAFTTTNGTRALVHAAEAERILVGAFVNLNAVVAVVRRQQFPVRIVCAGTSGAVTSEDILCAGAFVQALQHAAEMIPENDEARMARRLFRQAGQSRSELLRTLRDSRGGRNLLALGLEADIEVAGTLDTHPIVGEYFPQRNTIVPACDVPVALGPWVTVPAAEETRTNGPNSR